MRKASLLFLAFILILGTTHAFAALEQAFMWTGDNWKEVSMDGKVGYIFGLGNLADYEVSSAKFGGQANMACISRAFVDDLKSKTVMQVVAEVDKYYQENPDKIKSYVIDVVLRRCTTLCPPETPAKEKKK
jgi:hypothetical protein